MKFTEGVWNAREDIHVTSAVEVLELATHLDDTASSARNPPSPNPPEPFIRTLCASRHIKHRGDLISKPVITVTLTSPAPGIIGIEAKHFYGHPQYKEPKAILFPDGKLKFDSAQVQVNDSTATITSPEGKASATLDLRPNEFSINIQDAQGKYVAGLGKDTIQWILHNAATPLLAEKENASQTIHDLFHRSLPERRSYMAMSMGLEAGELVYGLGERFGPFIKNGQAMESSNDDGGSSSSSAYKCIPFYLTNRNYGVYVDQLDSVSFEVQSERMTKVQISVPGETLRLFVIVGTSPKDVLTSYTLLTGRPRLPPDWSYGLWLSTSFLTDYDEKTVMSYADGMDKHDIPLHVFHFDCFWMRPHSWCDFQFDPKYFPDPRSFLANLHKRGIKVCVWINPWVSQCSRLFMEGDEKEYFIKRIDGRTFQSDSWQPGTATLDFTNLDAVEWWQGYLVELLDLGVDTFKTDFGERITTEGVVYHDGSNPRTMHNYYSFLYNKAVWDVLVAKRGAAEACVFARSATTGGQRFPVHWGGDVDSEWTGLAETVRGGLSFGLSGFGYHSSDIGGFKGEGKHGGNSTAPPEGSRWCQFGLLSSHSRLHGSATARVPWSIDDEACLVLSKFTKLKNRLEPYFTSLSLSGAVALGHPLMRAMFLEFPEDRSMWYLDQQYMLGGSLLVAPVFGEREVEYYLPPGKWTNILTGQETEGPGWKKESHTMMTLPVLLRPGHAVIMGKEGHRVTDSIAKRGFTVIVSRQIKESTTISTALRGGKTIDVVLEPITDKSSSTVRGIKVSSKGDSTPFDVIVLGDGQGLDSQNLVSAEAQNGVCEVRFT